MDQNTTHTSYSAVLQNARHLHDSQDFAEAEKAAVEGIGLMMAASISANNPKLAEAYRLHTNICAELAMGDLMHYRQWQEKAAISAAHRVEVLDLGMLTADVIDAKRILATIQFDIEKYAEALVVLESTRGQIVDLLEREEPGVTMVDLLVCCHSIAECLVALSREGEAVTLLAGTLHKVRAEHYRDFAVMEVFTGVSMQLTQLLAMQDALSTAVEA